MTRNHSEIDLNFRRGTTQTGQQFPPSGVFLEKTIQTILRHTNVSTTANFHIKTAADDVKSAMATLEASIQDDPNVRSQAAQLLKQHTASGQYKIQQVSYEGITTH